MGHLTSIAFPTHRNLTKNLCPRVGTFAFSARRNGTKSHRTMCSSVHWSSWKLSTAVSNRGKNTFYTKTLVLTTHFQYKLMEHLTLWGFCGLLILNIDSLFVRESSIGILLNIFYPLTRRMPLLKITSACRTKRKVGIFDLI